MSGSLKYFMTIGHWLSLTALRTDQYVPFNGMQYSNFNDVRIQKISIRYIR